MITVKWADEAVRFPQVEFRRIFHQIKRPVPPGAEMITAYTDGQVTLRSARARDGGYHEAHDMSGMQGVYAGDFVVHGLDILRGSVGISDATGAISAVCVLCAPNDRADPSYFAWVIRAMAFSGFPKALARGVREGGADFRRWDTLAELPVPKPSFEDQVRIADYLDQETKRIDILIGNKQKLIEALKARTESLIAEFIDPVQLEFGEVPLKSIAHLRVSNVDKKSVDGEVEVMLCNYTDVYYHRRIDSSLHFMRATADAGQIARLAILPDDLLITKDSETADDIGVPALVVTECPGVVLGYHLALLRPYKVLGTYLYWVFMSRLTRDRLALAASGVTRFGLRQDSIASLPIPFPPTEVQMRIASKLNQAQESLDAAIEMLNAQILLLQERRQALITAAVTGQLEI